MDNDTVGRLADSSVEPTGFGDQLGIEDRRSGRSYVLSLPIR